MSTLSENSKRPGIVLLLLLCSVAAFAHVVPGELDKLPRTDIALIYLQLGFTHIFPFGVDHILFILSLFLLSPRLKPILWQATTFTVAHSITLSLAMYQTINVPASIIEPLIALSILYVALENIISPRFKKARIGIVFLFGLIHGLGFAGALGQLGLPQNSYLLSLVMFNLGVELGQVLVILLAWFLIAKWFKDKPYYQKKVVVPLSVLIATIAFVWTIERVFFS